MKFKVFAIGIITIIIIANAQIVLHIIYQPLGQELQQIYKLLTPFILDQLLSTLTTILPSLSNFLTTALLPLNAVVIWDPPQEKTTTTSTAIPTVAEAEYYVHFTGAVYCYEDVKTWTCDECRKTGTDVTLVGLHENIIHNTRAIVTINNHAKEIVVTWRGTYNIQNLIADLILLPLESVEKSEEIKVYRGDWHAMESLYDSVTANLTALLTAHPDYQVVITGHSLGGTEASLYLFKIKFNDVFPRDTSFKLFTYGAPRSGNKAFVDWYNRQTFPVARVVNNADAAPHLASSYPLGYLHQNTEFWIHPTDLHGFPTKTKICRQDVYEDKTCSNSRGPIYSILDHMNYYTVNYTVCILKELPLVLAGLI